MKNRLVVESPLFMVPAWVIALAILWFSAQGVI